ncbi:hypothetical protein [Anianabacter salinae]|uniref:hypothetical protein n=1 Tax=Anianabacter salinae TaxID=2851023 RepID=UPI00225E5692|nr:hypothetical protein [Anianabacter salinae]MBV0914110.1 hypothetical protein [Anianabacter salinae]
MSDFVVIDSREFLGALAILGDTLAQQVSDAADRHGVAISDDVPPPEHWLEPDEANIIHGLIEAIRLLETSGATGLPKGKEALLRPLISGKVNIVREGSKA